LIVHALTRHLTAKAFLHRLISYVELIYLFPCCTYCFFQTFHKP
jgi:hypothetical protein